MLVAFELQNAADPILVLPATSEQASRVRIVDDAAVAHHGATSCRSNNFTEGCNSILKRHYVLEKLLSIIVIRRLGSSILRAQPGDVAEDTVGHKQRAANGPADLRSPDPAQASVRDAAGLRT